ncbi:MAG: hypothetical protein IJ294_04360 [Clostridia bacterium]|nr:hypothetical protein [Clostridia bacterium]
MSLIFKLLRAILNGSAFKILLMVGLIWLALNTVCWVLGAIGLRSLGRRAGVYPLYTACYPNGQIYYTLRLTHKERLARRTAWLIWWSLVLVALSAACLIWAAVFHLQAIHPLLGLLLVMVAVLALMIALILYIGVRMLEFQALHKLLKNKAILAVCVIGTIFAVPLQRIFIFIKSR